jgi:aminocarboxymuconate-semialdehyde decarboxylase
VHDQSALRHLVDVVGADHVVLGSNYPGDMGSSDPAAEIRQPSLRSDAEKESILGANAERMLDHLRTDRSQADLRDVGLE